jgi:ABC-type molybdenum transport system ATPase subunit/photorepair protein PhrA
VARRRSIEPIPSVGDGVAALREVSVRWGSTTVLHGIDLDVGRGSHWEVRGDNGSGKTTLLRVLAGTCPPSSGRRQGVRPVAFVPAAIDPPALPVRTWARSVRRRGRSFDDALDALGFRGDASRSFRRLSYGNLRKVLLADALTSDAALVVLDEAREGLDDAGLDGLAELVRSWCGDGGAVVVADQAAHGVPAGAHHLIVRDGSITTAPPSTPPSPVDGPGEATVTLVGPADRRTELTDLAARLGFRPETDD